MEKPRQDTHFVLNGLSAACEVARGRVTVIPVPMHWRRGRGVLGRLGGAGRALAFLGAHLRMVGRVWRNADADLIVVREFITSIVPIVWPLLFPLRHRVCFLMNHNLQEAHERSLERTILRVLYRSGMRFACFESTVGWAEIGIAPRADRILPVPLPVSDLAPPRPAADLDRAPVIGVVGAVRAEKGTHEVVERLLELKRTGRLATHIVVGRPMPAGFTAPDIDVEFIDTTDREGYIAALDRCDVVVLNYQRSRYEYRGSGVVAEAVARRAVVVAPDFPIMRKQLTRPEPVGTFFQDLEDLERAVREAVELGRVAHPDLWDAHARARSPAAIAARYDAFVRGGKIGAASREKHRHLPTELLERQRPGHGQPGREVHDVA